jgi:class 3 adenylate cyclase/tetratricopeptide (TPR) repeat protein
MITCPSCGRENPDGFEFCGYCTTPLAVASSAAREERKVVTVLFCDLVGFTARAEQLDPEEVRAVLAPYHSRVRDELERRGGTVEKFIGDAVMALFGAPTAHEDDPERAVRASLAIRDFARQEGLELRVGITTGEALVSIDARPEAGEGMASGDVVNTAARLQSAAPVNGVVVDQTTHRATREAIDYRELQPVEAKGKAQPIAIWEVLEAHARFGPEVLDHVAGELVGREHEIDALWAAFERVRRERSPQLVTLVGVPGIGKSRLLYELSRRVDDEPELTTWRQGRCLAYGDGITFWALAEIVKAQAGILEADDDATAAEKLRLAAEQVVEPADADWVAARLRPLAGLEDESELGGGRASEAFAAWRRFLEELAAMRPLILVFEDLQWADEGLLDFVDQLVEWVDEVPLLVVCTARPELLARRPNWGGGKLNASTVALEPLSDVETARLMGTLLGRSVLPADVQQTLLERAGGNPLYAEQFTQLYLERGSADELPLPETLQGIISARLDGLPAEEKAFLHAGAVIGKVFWAGALADAAVDPEQVAHSLVRKGFLRRQRRSSVAGEVELAFAHALVRDVAYGQMPRSERASRHRAVAEWLESLGRNEDHAEMLAYHWRSAYEFAGASGEDTTDLAERTRLALAEAGDRAFGLNAFGPAVAYYTDALALWPTDTTGRAELLFRRAHALHVMGDDGQEAALLEARDALLEIGDAGTAGQAEAFLSRAAWYRGHGEEARAHIDRAQRLVADAGRTVAKARVLSLLARLHMLSNEQEEAIAIGAEALELAETLDLDELRVHALTTVGTAKAWLDGSGDAELERALELAEAINSPLAAGALNNLGVWAIQRGEIARAEEFVTATLRVAEEFGDRELMRFARGNLLWYRVFDGRWDEALEEADRFIAECEASPHNMETAARSARARIRFARGDTAGALVDLERDLALSRELGDPQRVLSALLELADGLAWLGRDDEARALAAEGIEIARANPALGAHLGAIADHARALGVAAEVIEVASSAPDGPWRDATLAMARGDLEQAAQFFERARIFVFEAEVRFVAAEWLFEGGATTDGLAELEKALAFFRSVDATFFLDRGEALLREARSA